MANAVRSLSEMWRRHSMALWVVMVLRLALTPQAHSQSFSVLYSFANSPDAANPTSILVSDANGILYGTTFFGGANACGCGAVFKLTAGDREEVLYSFTGGSDGANPFAGLIRDAAGNLYGATTFGGDLSCGPPAGCGTVFKMDTTGTYTGVYLPAGQYAVTGRLSIYSKPVKVVGAGVWYSQFVAPQGQTDTDTGWDLQSGASGSTFTGFAWFGNYTTRQDGPGHTWDLRNQSNITIDNVWATGSKTAAVIVGLPESPIRNLKITNVHINATKGASIQYTDILAKDFVVRAQQGELVIIGNGVRGSLK